MAEGKGTETAEVKAAEKKAVAQRKREEPDEPIGHLSRQEKKRQEEQWEEGQLVAQDLIEEKENRADDDPLEIAKQENLNKEAVKAGEAERMQAVHGKDEDEDDK